jgi:hypothetical protein
LNSLVGNNSELGMVIPTIISQTNDGIKVTKVIGLNVMVQMAIFFGEFTGVIMDILVQLLIINRRGVSVMSEHSQTIG